MEHSLAREYASKMAQCPVQHQGSLDEQLSIVRIAANKLGCYDAADFLMSMIDDRKVNDGDA